MDITYDALHLFIDGEWIGASERETAPVINPATQIQIGRVPLATAADLDRALQAAVPAFDVWRNTVPAERARILKRAAELMRERAEHIATVMTLEEGKPLAESRDEVLRAADYFEWFAEEARRIDGRVVPSNRPGVQQLVKKQAIGPVAAFTPWNFPAITPARKLSAALAAGCSVIIKPGEESPATALALARALDDAGLPKGVLQVVFGVPDQVSTQLIASPVIRKVTFTGSVPIGRLLSARAAEGVKPITLELGGHGPVLVFNDADVEKAAVEGAANRFRGTGQVCISSTRFLIQREVYDEFVGHFVRATSALKVGNGMDAGTQVGPLANPRQLAKMEELIADAVERGATILAGGKRIEGEGYFFEPTVLADVPKDARVMHEEPFGPIAVLMRFDALADGLAEANRLPYGLSAYAFTSSARTAIDVADGLEAGMIGINQYRIVSTELPFGGMKESGHGSEGGTEGIEYYLTHKFISQA
ncbi:MULTISPECIES: NAD-dependent succinate-semialdehyde dehydrogenase [Burkholderia]|jgi:succinate-semialdehyde dehydrogenase/glutarate-semialdehyde dehydrogenase|uniref:Succinate semialdehyde dehydrogenase n=1 Tax=Burkholderia vietnamiensis (strain G4 / LMG 22486) TaxID=269482 RepID=A4JNP5_BURVG|nr:MULTISPECIES: NAD-dependent succinate-semialdehyde dehydrogenase [Burkholderia]ABO57898.1 succinate semialdehyde dehydrogenase [Burkholderia vietnamiensis G4]KVF40065.1 NAD-dependent succinate-semialdehyde dehydrogenase [Burkholderia vietnamiensis]KVF72768.1 NAD-dependent succinate-semialdehyde dehydrogenase [Burkholderia vietnamiensis]KVR79106.1 NAD-dependent succinate-semialdehyde dehydrogenase [Burkholderia vietnamiensis]KVS29236.1 NAD-dependent succinate-semialdehyde dehydrogenase [Burk